ncbi:glycosyltransferase family protein [Candidatus Enterovibrio escicola]|uniref:glycosyltransferase family protein n=1 Tax=Candidatus Enterovibrio escicola TaxID=1927127 RepID=UPI001237A4C2|nr:glycosyltransferase [Candidatus Enterovibrio escacola]
MSKILLCFSSHLYIEDEFKLTSYYEGLISDLNKHSNEVLVCNTAEFLCRPWNGNNVESKIIDVVRLKQRIKSFDPELIISFNNSKLSFLESEFDCPIIIWQADSFEYYNDKDRLIKDPNRYLYFGLSEDDTPNLVNIGVNRKNIFCIKSGTSVIAEKIPKITNISFIGSNFIGTSKLYETLVTNGSRKAREAIKFLSENFYIEPRGYLKGIGLERISNILNTQDIASISSCQNRITTLNLMTEFGLDLYGTDSWIRTAAYYPGLALSYIQEQKYSLKHNQDIYNSSRLCLNVSHSQAVNAFPWRVMDIMASNGCLLSNYNKGLKCFLKKYVDIPMYKSCGEAHTLARKLLKDKIYRNELILSCQRCINENGRWKHRFAEIEQYTNIKLLNSENTEQKDEIYLTRDDFLSPYYSFYIKMIIGTARITPRSMHAIMYKIALSMGISIDYKTIKKVMEKQSV